ncbi:unnamed protein product [Rotaria sordida]|uniref:HAT C-terminal dimerisation domain-containing protein n=1 Tax=Rotaria sordida TaxID=392033 RepID=A0A815QEI1_9BILA|nr:unnamed protein product [Rotaria sordida]
MSSTTTIEIEDLPPDPTTISRNIDRMYAHYKKQLIQLCKSMDYFCLTADFWTESYTVFHEGLSYCGLLLNHVDLEFQSQAFLLGCFPYEMENKRAATIRSFVDDILQSFGLKLDEEKYIMNDNEPTMKCTFSLNCKRIGSSDHYLNKQLQHAFTSQMIDGEDVTCELAQEMFDSVKHTVSSVRRMHKQQNLSKKLILYSDTRFSGAYNMFTVFLNVFDELDKILDSKLLTYYSRIDKDLLHDICQFLFPFNTVLQTLSDSKRPTLHRVLPFKQFLINKCNINNYDKEGKRLDEKWELSNEHLIATLLHPNLKHFHMCPHLRERAICLLKEEMMKCQQSAQSKCTSSSISSVPSSSSISSIPSSSSISSIPSSSSISSIPSSSSISSIPSSSSTSSMRASISSIPSSSSISSTSCSSLSTSSISSSSSSKSISITNSSARKELLMAIYDKQPVVPEKSTIEQELEKSLTSTSMVRDEEEDDILGYWKEHQTLFPLIASIARKILGIPASNTSVERLFSSCKNTITDKRTRLGAEKLNKMMFLQKNMNLLQEKFHVNFTATNDNQNTKRKNDTTILNEQSIQKKMKLHEVAIDYQDDDEYLVNIESDNEK